MYYLNKGEEFMVVHRSKKTLLLDKFDAKSMKCLSSVEVADFSKAYCIFERLLTLNNRHFLLYSSYDKKKKKDRLFYREIDFKLGNFKSEEQVMIEVDGEIPMDDKSLIDAEQKHIFSHSFNPNRYRFEFSKDSSAILVRHRMKRKKRKDSENKEKMGLYVFNNVLEKVWGRAVEMPYFEPEMTLLDYGVDSKQNGYVFLQKSDRALELLQYNKGTLQKTIPLNGFTKYIYQSQILEKQDGNLVFTGFTSNKEKGNAPSGLYFFKVDVDKEKPLSDLNTQSISSSLKDKCNSSDSKNSFLNLHLKDCFLQNDGSLILIGEAAQSAYSSYSKVEEKTHILMAKLSTDGAYKWITAIPKRQTLYTGYQYRKMTDQHVLFFVDDIANHKKNNDPTIFAFEKGRYMVRCSVSDESGRAKKGVYIPTESKYCPSAGNIHFLSDQEFIFWGWSFSSQGQMSTYNKIPIGFPMSPLPNSGKSKSIVKGVFSR
jgi:hypothetical protein